jgi:hypothetical protein
MTFAKDSPAWVCPRLDFRLDTEVLLKDSEEVLKIPNPILLGLVWSSLVAALDGLFLSTFINGNAFHLIIV